VNVPEPRKLGLRAKELQVTWCTSISLAQLISRWLANRINCNYQINYNTLCPVGAILCLNEA